MALMQVYQQQNQQYGLIFTLSKLYQDKSYVNGVLNPRQSQLDFKVYQLVLRIEIQC